MKTKEIKKLIMSEIRLYQLTNNKDYLEQIKVSLEILQAQVERDLLAKQLEDLR